MKHTLAWNHGVALDSGRSSAIVCIFHACLLTIHAELIMSWKLPHTWQRMCPYFGLFFACPEATVIQAKRA